MARPQSKQQQAAIEAIVAALRKGMTPEVRRAEYHAVPDRTWRRWVTIARETLKGQKLPPEKPLIELVPAKAKRNRKPKASSPEPPPQKEPPREGEHIPADSSVTGNDDDGEDGETVILLTPDGPKEVSLTTAILKGGRWNGYGVLERLDAIFNLAMGGHEGAVKRIGHRGHVHLDPSAAVANLELARKTAVDMAKVMDKVYSAEAAKRISDAVLEALRKRDPKLADLVTADIRVSLKELASNAYEPKG